MTLARGILDTTTEPWNNAALVKSFNAFTEYAKADDSWTGSLVDWPHDQMLLIQLKDDEKQRNLTITGIPFDSVNVTNGWNWISFPSLLTMDLTGVSPIHHTGGFENGDLLKSPNNFSKYDNVTGKWSGSLESLTPGRGYLIKLKNAGILTFHGEFGGDVDTVDDEIPRSDVTMTVQASVYVDRNLKESGSLKAYNSNGDLVGSTTFIKGFFISLSNTAGSSTATISFEFNDVQLYETVEFKNNGIATVSLNAGTIEFVIEMPVGISWVSSPLILENPTFNDQMADHGKKWTDGDSIESQGNTSISYVQTTESWTTADGAFTDWPHEQTLKITLASVQRVTIIGTPFNSVTVARGWNWVSFPRIWEMELLAGSMFHSGGFASDDVIKSATKFSQFDTTRNRFKGGLKTMVPGKGYEMYVENPGNITFYGGPYVDDSDSDTFSCISDDGVPGSISTMLLNATVYLNSSLSPPAEKRPAGVLSAYNDDDELIGVVECKSGIELCRISISDPASAPGHTTSKIIKFKLSIENTGSFKRTCTTHDLSTVIEFDGDQGPPLRTSLYQDAAPSPPNSPPLPPSPPVIS